MRQHFWRLAGVRGSCRRVPPRALPVGPPGVSPQVKPSVRGASWAGVEGSGAAREPVRGPAGGTPGRARGVATTPGVTLREKLWPDGGTNGPLRSTVRGRGSPRCRRSRALPPGPVVASLWAVSSGTSRRSPARPGEANLPGAGQGQRRGAVSPSAGPAVHTRHEPAESRPHPAYAEHPPGSGGQT